MPAKWLVALCVMLFSTAVYAASLPKEPPVPSMPTVSHAGLKDSDVFKEQQQILPQAWVLHINARYSATEAKAQVAKLIKAGFAAFAISHGDTTNLYIGPSVSQSQLQAAKQQLQKQFDLIASIEDYQVSWPTP